MDRSTTNIAKGQLGFIDFIIKPTFESAHLMLPKAYRFVDGCKENRAEWDSRIDEYEQIMIQEMAKAVE